MAVTTVAFFITYTCDGTQAVFPFPYYFISPQDLLVQGNNFGTVTTYNLNSDYQIVGTPNTFGDYNTGANIVFNTGGPINNPPVAGTVLLIDRITPRTQTVILIDNTAYTADTFNHVFDKLTLIAQESGIGGTFGTFIGYALAPPTNTNYPLNSVFLNANDIPGGMWGWVLTAEGWREFANISLL